MLHYAEMEVPDPEQKAALQMSAAGVGIQGLAGGVGRRGGGKGLREGRGGGNG